MMYQVTIEYTIEPPQGGCFSEKYIWRGKADFHDVVHYAEADARLALGLYYGKGIKITTTQVSVAELEDCPTCRGTGQLGSLFGHYTCPRCQGQRYLAVGGYYRGF